MDVFAKTTFTFPLEVEVTKDMTRNNQNHGDKGRAIKYDPQRGAYYTRYEWAKEESLIDIAVQAVASIADKPLSDIDIFARINPDALEALFEPTSDGSRSDEGGVWFLLAEHRIIVQSDGLIEIYPPPHDEDTAPGREKAVRPLQGDIRV